MLGDGRAILLGEHRTPDGRLVDIQFKGSGRTRFSRGGDGRPPSARCSASTSSARRWPPSASRPPGASRSSPPASGSTGNASTGAILTRVAASHIRVGTFEYAARRGETTLRALADYAINRHYPELADAPQKHLEFFRARRRPAGRARSRVGSTSGSSTGS